MRCWPVSHVWSGRGGPAFFGARKAELADTTELVEEATDLGLLEALRKVAKVDDGRWFGGLGGNLFCLALLGL